MTYELIEQKDVKISAQNRKYNCAAQPIEPNTTYRVSFDKVDIFESSTQAVGLLVYNVTQEKA